MYLYRLLDEICCSLVVGRFLDLRHLQHGHLLREVLVVAAPVEEEEEEEVQSESAYPIGSALWPDCSSIRRLILIDLSTTLAVAMNAPEEAAAAAAARRSLAALRRSLDAPHT